MRRPMITFARTHPVAPVAEPQQPLQRSTASTGVAALTVPAPGAGDLAQIRQLEKVGGWTPRDRLRFLWFRLRLAVPDMNYAARRIVELQTRLP